MAVVIKASKDAEIKDASGKVITVKEGEVLPHNRKDLLYIPASQIIVDPERNQRAPIRTDRRLLKEEIRLEGQINPVEVSKTPDGKVQLETGFGRHQVVSELYAEGLIENDTLICKLIAPREEVDAIRHNISENRGRTNLSPLDIAWILRRLTEKHGYGAKQCAELFKDEKGNPPSRSWFDQHMNLHHLTKKLQTAVHEGKIGLTSANKIAKLPKDKQEPAWEAARKIQEKYEAGQFTDEGGEWEAENAEEAAAEGAAEGTPAEGAPEGDGAKAAKAKKGKASAAKGGKTDGKKGNTNPSGIRRGGQGRVSSAAVTAALREQGHAKAAGARRLADVKAFLHDHKDVVNVKPVVRTLFTVLEDFIAGKFDEAEAFAKINDAADKGK